MATATERAIHDHLSWDGLESVNGFRGEDGDMDGGRFRHDFGVRVGRKQNRDCPIRDKALQAQLSARRRA